MAEFTLTERTEPLTLKEVLDFIDDTNISKMDAHELKSRIVDVVQDTRNNAIDEFAQELKFIKKWKSDVVEGFCKYDASSLEELVENVRNKAIDEFAERLKCELNEEIIPDKEKFKYERKIQEQICHQNTTLKRAIKYVEVIAEQMKGGAK